MYLQGVVTRREVPYTATLCQEYRDGVVSRVTVEGLLTFSALTNLTTLLQPPRYIVSDRLAPTTTTTTTTTSTTAPPTSTAATQAAYSQLVDRSGSFVVERTFRSSRPESDSHLVAQPLPATLFPPTEPTAPTPNPLRQFYPVDEDDPVVMVNDDVIRAAQVSDLAASCGAPTGFSVFLLIFSTVLTLD